MMVKDYVGLGSNLDHPRRQLQAAYTAIQQLPDTRVLGDSGLFRSPPMGPQDQPDYLNAVVLIETELSPHQLLTALQAIEQQQGRVRKRHWGERTLDLDILLYGNEQISEKDLVIPHIGIPEREFVLYPLQRLDADLTIPGMGDLNDLIAACPRGGLTYIGGFDA